MAVRTAPPCVIVPAAAYFSLVWVFLHIILTFIQTYHLVPQRFSTVKGTDAIS